jgi:signal transduction histidine kinase
MTISLFTNFSIFVVLIVVFTVAYISYIIYDDQAEKIISILKNQSDKVERTLNNNVDYTFHTMDYIGKQIVANGGGQNKQYIADLLKSFHIDNGISSLLSWNAFMWVDENNIITVDSTNGVLKQGIDLTKKEYSEFFQGAPGKLYLGEPMVSEVNKEWVIPVGLGVTTEEGKYLGSVLAGFNIQSLRDLLQNSLNDAEVSYNLMDRDYVTMMVSSDKGLEFIDKRLLTKIIESIEKYSCNEGVIASPNIFSKQPFVLFKVLSQYNYILVLSYDAEVANKAIWDSIEVRAIQFCLFGALIIIMLSILRMKILKPIGILFNSAKLIADGDYSGQLPKFYLNEIDSLANELSKIKQTKMELKSYIDFIDSTRGFMIHELRAPASIIKLSNSMLHNNPSPEDEKYYSNQIEKAANNILENINYFLTLMKIQAGKKDVEMSEEYIDVKEKLNFAIGLGRSYADQKHILIHTKDIADDLPKLRCIPLQFISIISNLVTNAGKYNNENGKIFISGYLNADKDLQIDVRDTGFGIDPKDFDKLFQKYERMSNAQDNKIVGTGLGLSFVKSAVETSLNGKVIVKSRVGEGTTITIILPNKRLRAVGVSHTDYGLH